MHGRSHHLQGSFKLTLPRCKELSTVKSRLIEICLLESILILCLLSQIREKSDKYPRVHDDDKCHPNRVSFQCRVRYPSTKTPIMPSKLPFTILPYSEGACVNRKLTLSPLCVLRIASANVGEISITLSFPSGLSPPSLVNLSPRGTVLVTTRALSTELLMTLIASPERIP